MATAVFEQMTISSGETDRGKKSSFSTKNHGAGEFADFIKDKPKLIYSTSTRTDHTQKTSKNSQDKQKLSEDREPKIVDQKKRSEKESDIDLEAMNLVAPINQMDPIDVVPLSAENGEFIVSVEGDKNIFGQVFVVPVINNVTKSTVTAKPELVVSELSTETNIRIIDISADSSDNNKENIAVNTNDKIVAVFSNQNSLVGSELSDQEQSIIHNMKSFKLLGEFSNDFDKSNKNLNTAQEATSNQVASNERVVAQNLGVLLKSAVVENAQSLQASARIIKEDISKLITISSNLLLADETKQGQSVLAKMNRDSESKISSVAQAEPEIKENFTGLEQDLRESSSKKHSMLESFGGMLEANGEDLFQVSFRENTLNLGPKNEAPKPDMQVSLAVREVLNVSNNVGKKEITINLFPEALGSVKVEILSVLGENGVRKIESIKIIAEKRETLEILEKSRIDLEKNLKEVTNTKEETSLQFEMNHQGKGSSGAYFDSQQERDNWMNNFAPLVAKEELTNDSMEGSQSLGYITEDSINIKV